MGGRGGRRAGAGRPRGSPNKGSQIADDETASGQQMPLQFMLEIMRNPNEPAERRERMAALAAPFCHAKLNAVAVQNDAPSRSAPLVQIEFVAPAGYAVDPAGRLLKQGATIDAEVLRIEKRTSELQ
jgi:hypothetical protein